MKRGIFNVQTNEISYEDLSALEVQELADNAPALEHPAPPSTPAEKLAAAGLTVDELKELLGL
jgi:hypothetical protein